MIPEAPAVAYRLLAKTDHSALGQLWWESWRSTGLGVAQQTTKETLRHRLDQELADGWEVTVAVREQRLVGFLAIKARLAVLNQLFIAPDAKRQGIGKGLLALAKAKMPEGFSLRTAADNQAACRFYERAGLTHTGTATHSTLDHAIAIYHWKLSANPGVEKELA